MKISKLVAMMACCAMTTAAMAQHEKPKEAPKDMKKMAQPAADKKADASGMEEAMMAAGAVGEQHKWISKMVGSWDATVKMMMPGQPPMESKATMTTEMMFGGRFSHSMFKGDFGGMPFEGVATMGYNNLSGKFESTWADNMSTGMMFSTGTADKDGKVLTMTGECVDPMTKKPCKMRMVTTIKNDNEFVDEFYKTVDGKESKEMEIAYVRSKGAEKEKGAMDKVKDEGDKLKKRAEEEMKKHLPAK